jgi:hypothetical protein
LGPGGLGLLQGTTAQVFAVAATCFAMSYGLCFLMFGIRRAGRMLPAHEERMLEIIEE